VRILHDSAALNAISFTTLFMRKNEKPQTNANYA